MEKRKSKKVVKKPAVKAAAAKVSVPVKGKGTAVVKKVSYKTGLLCRKVKGKVSGLSKVAAAKPWKKVVGVTGTLCEKVGSKTGDVIGKFSRIVKKSAADMGESFKAGMASVKTRRIDDDVIAPVKKPAVSKGKSKSAAKAKSRLQKFVSDDIAIAEIGAAVKVPAAAANESAVAAEELGAALAGAVSEVQPPVEAAAAEAGVAAQEEVQTAVEDAAAVDAELEREIEELTKEIKEE
ncbi:MAG: hypothetical protein HQL22_05995 [Candidatus Omnitrophica bacterium]|nr:hypothetical protein [Candidatus Omnitrophota bacterium]